MNLDAFGLLDGLKNLGPLETVLVEQARFAMVKRSARGQVDVISPIPCPYNYGCIPGRDGGDGDPLDAVLLGRRVAAGTRVQASVVGVVAFVDAGLPDPKVICSVDPVTPLELVGVEQFFNLYAVAKRGLALARRRRGETRSLGWLPQSVWGTC